MFISVFDVYPIGKIQFAIGKVEFASAASRAPYAHAASRRHSCVQSANLGQARGQGVPVPCVVPVVVAVTVA